MSDPMQSLTLDDAMGRHWTITHEATVVGMKWTIYCYNREMNPAALDMLYPGGVAHGWLERWETEPRAILVAHMGLFGVAPKVQPVEGDQS